MHYHDITFALHCRCYKKMTFNSKKSLLITNISQGKRQNINILICFISLGTTTKEH